MNPTHADQSPAVQLVDCQVDFGDVIVGPVSLEVDWGESVALVGPSRSGKTAAVRLVRGDFRPTAGQALVSGTAVDWLAERDRRAFLRRLMSSVDQSPVMLPELSVAENVALPLMLDGIDPSAALARANQTLSGVGLDGFGERSVAPLSADQLQAVAVARALVRPTSIVLADEPTASLDDVNADRVARQLLACVERDRSRCLLVATQDHALAERCDRVVHLAEGTWS